MKKQNKKYKIKFTLNHKNNISQKIMKNINVLRKNNESQNLLYFNTSGRIVFTINFKKNTINNIKKLLPNNTNSKNKFFWYFDISRKFIVKIIAVMINKLNA